MKSIRITTLKTIALLLIPVFVAGCQQSVDSVQSSSAGAAAKASGGLSNGRVESEPNRPVSTVNGELDAVATIRPVTPDTLAVHEDLDATVWMRTSAEYQILVTDTYRRALVAVDEGLGKPNWSAIPDQAAGLASATGDVDRLPAAVILDIDETVLDNSQFQVECILSEPFQFAGESWTDWCSRAEATPIAGVQDFVAGCRQRGVAIRYFTNRDNDVREATMENLRKYGLVPADESAEDELLCKNDRSEWGSDKTNRRDFVASHFRVLVLVGDDLNDFLFTGENATPPERTSAAMEANEMWGTRWFLLPNANYGGWEKSIQEYRFPAERVDYLRLKLESLQGVPAESGPAQ